MSPKKRRQCAFRLAVQAVSGGYSMGKTKSEGCTTRNGPKKVLDSLGKKTREGVRKQSRDRQDRQEHSSEGQSSSQGSVESGACWWPWSQQASVPPGETRAEAVVTTPVRATSENSRRMKAIARSGIKFMASCYAQGVLPVKRLRLSKQIQGDWGRTKPTSNSGPFGRCLRCASLT